MKILVLNGSPRLNGNTAEMVSVFQDAAESNGHIVKIFNVCKMKHQRLPGLRVLPWGGTGKVCPKG